MASCTRCGSKQNGTQTYCENCGMFLPTFAVYNPGQPEYRVTPEIPPYSSGPFFSYIPIKTTSPISRVIRETLAIVGLLIAGFGLFGFFNHLISTSWALVLGLLLILIGSIFASIYIFGANFTPRLRWLTILLSLIAVTAVGFVLLIIVSAIVNQNTLGKDFGFGSTIFFYGMGIVALVLW